MVYQLDICSFFLVWNPPVAYNVVSFTLDALQNYRNCMQNQILFQNPITFHKMSQRVSLSCCTTIDPLFASASRFSSSCLIKTLRIDSKTLATPRPSCISIGWVNSNPFNLPPNITSRISGCHSPRQTLPCTLFFRACFDQSSCSWV